MPKYLSGLLVMLCLATSAYAETPEIPDSTKSQPSSVKDDDCFWQTKLLDNWHLKANMKKLIDSFSLSENTGYNDKELHDSRSVGLSLEYRY